MGARSSAGAVGHARDRHPLSARPPRHGRLPSALQVELGPLLVRIERAVASVGGVGRVHVCRWGDGGEHFHVWFIARPERLPQLKGSFVAIWDDILPPLPEALWRENLDTVAAALSAG